MTKQLSPRLVPAQGSAGPGADFAANRFALRSPWALAKRLASIGDMKPRPETCRTLRPNSVALDQIAESQGAHDTAAQFQALLETYPARAVARVTLHPGARQNTRELDDRGREAAPPPN